jgi:spermidine dehydrogenase
MSPAELLRVGLLPQAGADPYPPALTGLRGSHDGAFEVAHRLRDGVRPDAFGTPERVDGRYDLIVVGAGISGLAAAHYYRKTAGPRAKILILDNHDDFGGHARRNEFTVGNRTLIGYGGTQSIDTPSKYSTEAKGLLTELGIDTQAFHQAFDQEYFARLQLSEGTFFDRETFGADRLVPQPDGMGWLEFLAKTPLAPAVRQELVRLHTSSEDYLPGMTPAEKLQLLSKTSYKDYLLKHARLSADAVKVLQSSTHDYFGVGIDAVPAGDCRGLGKPGFEGLGLGHEAGPGQGLTSRLEHDEPYIFHFPDGNATIARLLVRGMIPGVLDGSTMTDIVTARARYRMLDLPVHPVRLRLSSTVVQVRHRQPNARGDVEVTYVRDGKAYVATAGRCVLACWHGVIPHICPELPTAQKEALKYGVKVPLLYTNVALRHWTSLARQGVHAISAPGSRWTRAEIDFPVSIGRYRFAQGPDDPALLFMIQTPCQPGLPSRDQHRIGRAVLLGTTYAQLERSIREQLVRMLGPGGFDPARDIAGITVNRWSHGYTYEYNSLWDPGWPAGQAPNEVARQRRGNITIANSDAAAYAYTNAAIDQAWRAVRELATRR